MIIGIHFTASPVTGSPDEKITQIGRGLFVCQGRLPDPEALLRDALGMEGWRIQEILEQREIDLDILREGFPHLANDVVDSGYAFHVEMIVR